jgi:hypothetical protein
MADQITNQDFFERNKAWVKPDAVDFATSLDPAQEKQFQQWVADNKIPFDPNEEQADYDMRGFWKALQDKDPKAMTAINPNDQQLHFPDYWKTPYHKTFSAESQWATDKAPTWNEQDQLVAPHGDIVYDERREKVTRMLRAFAQNIQKMKLLKQTQPATMQGGP